MSREILARRPWSQDRPYAPHKLMAGDRHINGMDKSEGYGVAKRLRPIDKLEPDILKSYLSFLGVCGKTCLEIAPPPPFLSNL